MANPSPPTRHALSWLTDSNYFSMPAWYPIHFLTSQLRRLPYPQADYHGKTVIVTGANVGLGLEAARHFCRLGAAKVILGCRDVDKGKAAGADIEASTSRGAGGGVVDVWQVDLGSFESNAGVAIGTYVECDGGFESTIAVNVVSTFLMALLLLPVLRRSAARHNVAPNLVVVSSDALLFAKFSERHQPNIFDAFKGRASMNEDRYNTSKLLEVLIVRQLASEMVPNDPVIINTLTPGLCRSNLFRHSGGLLRALLEIGVRIIGRSSEVGSRCLISAAAGGRETHGGYMENCKLRDPGPFVTSDEGKKVQKRVYVELLEVLEEVEPGITKNVRG
ncbi:dehydrogenase/reductase SDR family member 13 [Diaporthe helianthi]|uniref:Dehydrogenase/reductase SDR family member 13 n=1 Tax=Diaporthe helianthi TaxID=158607 RepID=A0A2P5HWV7_DIAHE|nr:dehydrogenase/reductase SDR family member 13 [Diaporthe helianthi]